jgi:hypothetical protein
LRTLAPWSELAGITDTRQTNNGPARRHLNMTAGDAREACTALSAVATNHRN